MNQIGTIHRQWSEQPSHDDFPIGHIAYYVSLRRRRDCSETAFRQQLLSTTLARQKEITALFPAKPDLRSTMAGLLFNVRPALGSQLLLGDPIYNALTKPNSDDLKTLERDHEDGFWVVLDEVTSTRLPESDAAALRGVIAECLDKSGILKEQTRPEAAAVKRKFQEVVIRISTWPALNNDPGFDGIRAICRLLSNSAVSEHIVSGVRTRLSQQQPDLPVPDLARMVSGLVDTYKEISELGHSKVLSEPFVIPLSGKGCVDLCLILYDQEEQWRSVVKPSTSFGDICAALSGVAEAGGFTNERYLDTIIPITRDYFPTRDWTPLAESIETRLQLGAGLASAEANQLLRTLYNLLLDGCVEVRRILDHLSRGGQLMHYLYQAQADGDKPCEAACIIAFLEERPDASPSPTGIGQFAAGQKVLATLLGEGDQHLAVEMSALMRTIKHTDLVLEVIAARKSFDLLAIECLRVAADADWAAELFTPQVVLESWHQLQEHLDEADSSDRFLRLIGRVSDTQEFIPFIQAVQFKQDNAGLYLAIVRVSPNQVFRDWCCRGLTNLDSASWKSALTSYDEVLKLALTLLELGASPRLNHHFQDALVEFAIEVARGESYAEVLGQLQSHRQQLF